MILSYDRYSTLTVYNKGGPNYRKPLLAVGGSWLYSLFWTVPPLLGWSSYGIEGAGTSCSVSWTVQTVQSHAYIICLFIFCLGIPVLVMFYCYGRLLLAVKQVERHQSVYVQVYMHVCVINYYCIFSPENALSWREWLLEQIVLCFSQSIHLEPKHSQNAQLISNSIGRGQAIINVITCGVARMVERTTVQRHKVINPSIHFLPLIWGWQQTEALFPPTSPGQFSSGFNTLETFFSEQTRTNKAVSSSAL